MDSILVPAGLIGLSLCSCVHLHLVEKGRRIQLQDDDQAHAYQNGTQEDGEDAGASVKEQEEAEDEGFPVEIDKWWLKVRIRKAVLVGVLAILDAAACVNLGWTASHGSVDKNETFTIVEDACMVAFWVRRSG